MEMDIGWGTSLLPSRERRPSGDDSFGGGVWGAFFGICSRSVFALFGGVDVDDRVNCEAANSMTCIASLTTASSGMPLDWSTLSPNVWALRTSAALSAEKIVQSFSQKLFSFFGLAGAVFGLAVKDALRHCCPARARGSVGHVLRRGVVAVAVYIRRDWDRDWVVRRSDEVHNLQMYRDWSLNGSVFIFAM
jgi:hypothetical protein